MKFSLEKKKLNLKVNWKLSRNETQVKENLFFIIEDNGKSFYGEIAPNSRYGESVSKIEKEYAHFIAQKPSSLMNAYEVLEANDYTHSFSFGVESCFTHLEAYKKGLTLFEQLGTSLKEVKTSFSIPIMEKEKIKDYLQDFLDYPALKIKIDKKCGLEMIQEVAKHFKGPLRIDANEAFDSLDDYLNFEQQIKTFTIEFIEQPFSAKDKDLYKKLKPISLFPLMADESIESRVDFKELSEMFHMVNIKLMKASGYKNGLRLLREAKKFGMKTMIGCMIETSLGISSAMYLAEYADFFDLDGFLLLEKDPFNLIINQKGHLSLLIKYFD